MRQIQNMLSAATQFNQASRRMGNHVITLVRDDKSYSVQNIYPNIRPNYKKLC
jgi:hypothetical protein